MKRSWICFAILAFFALVGLPSAAQSAVASSFLHLGRGQGTRGFDASAFHQAPTSYQNASSPEASILVNTVEDELNGDGDCSLREAIWAASSNSAYDACPAGEASGIDTITFDISGTITLTAQLVVTAGGPLAVDGGGGIVISGADSVRVLSIESGADCTLADLTIADGRADNGAGIYNDGSLTVSHCILSANSATSSGGGIYNLGALNVTQSTLSGNVGYFGGGIHNRGTASVANSSLSGNSATSSVNWMGCQGGSIYNHSLGTLSLANSTLDGNYGATGGGICDAGGTVTLVNSTLSGNRAHYGGGAIASSGTLRIYSSTLVGNDATWGMGGGIKSAPGFAMQNSILASNTAMYHGPDCSGVFTSYGHNLLGDREDCYFSPVTGFAPTTGDMVGVDPKLGPLRDNGGATLTHALLSGSLATDGGDPAGCTDHLGNPLTTDQRGSSRYGRCDIGAYERQHQVAGPNVVYLPCISKACPNGLLFDDFGDPASGWPILDIPSATYEYEAGEYRILVKSTDWWAGARPGVQASDYVAVVDARSAAGVPGSYGILFGLSDDWTQFYSFEVFTDGAYAIGRNDSGSWTLLASGTSASIHPGTTTNQLKIERNGSQIWAYANGQRLNIFDEGSYVGLGYVGLIVSAYGQPGVDVRFDNFTLNPISCGSSGSITREAGAAHMLEGVELDLSPRWLSSPSHR